MAQYYKTEDGNIYKYNSNKKYFLLCTPWKNGEDRRKNIDELNNPVSYNKHKAVFEINEAWRKTNFKWHYNGKTYETRGMVFDDVIIHTKTVNYSWSKKPYEMSWKEYTKLFKICKPHVWHHVRDWKDKNNMMHHHEYDDTYYLVMYQGKLIWVQVSQYIPQIYFYEFEGIDVEPKKWGGWTNIKCIRPIYCITDKTFM